MIREKELQEAISEIKLGNKIKARELIRNFIKSNPNNEHGWWIYAGIAENIEQRIYCLERVVEINPDFKDAKDRLFNSKEKFQGISKNNQKTKANKYQAKPRSNPLIFATVILAVVVFSLIAYIVYKEYLSLDTSLNSQPTISQEQSLDENSKQDEGDAYEAQIISKLELVIEKEILWNQKLTESVIDSQDSYIKNYGDIYFTTMEMRDLIIQRYSLGMGGPAYQDELSELALLAKPLADAYLEAEVVLGGLNPSSENRIPYENVLECLEARSLHYNYVYYFFNGDMEKAYPEISDNACDRYDSYYDLFITGLSD